MKLTKQFSVRRLPTIVSAPTTWRKHLEQDQMIALTLKGLDAAQAQALVSTHMPELLDEYEALAAELNRTPGGLASLVQYNLPPFFAGCSTAIAERDGRRVLLRNYDLGLDQLPGVLRVEETPDGGWIMGTGELAWGYLDGLNHHGLAVAITFGGRFYAGEGFVVPVIVRYLLRCATNVQQAVSMLQRLPHRLAQNYLLLDRSGASAVVFTDPKEGVTVLDGATCATNHQGVVVQPGHGVFVRTVERLSHLEARGLNLQLTDLLHPPLYQQQYSKGFGTLYSLELDPHTHVANYVWPTHAFQLTKEAQPHSFEVTYTEA